MVKQAAARTSVRKSVTKTSIVKRKARDDSDGEQSEVEVKVESEVVATTRASKRRVTVNRAYVEVVQRVRLARYLSPLFSEGW